MSWYYSYDAGGQRIRKMTGSTTTHFVYDQSGQLLGQYAGTAPSQEFVWLGDIPVAVLNGAAAEPEVLYVYSDHLNAPRVVVDKNSATRWRWLSEPFGTTAPEEAPAGLAPVALNLRFPGQYFDKESGLSYNYFRDYDGTSGRYSQSDPIGLAGGVNTYAYVEGNPVSYADPEGLQKGPMPQGTMYRGTGDINGQIWIGNQMRNGAIQNYSSIQRRANEKFGPGILSVCVRSTCDVQQPPNQCSASNPTGAATLPTSGPVMSAPGQSGCTCTQWALQASGQ